MGLREEFEVWYAGLGIRYFKAYEVLYAVDRPNNRMPDKVLWHNIVPTLVVLDRVRGYFDAPIVISSAYRAAPYNAQIGGAVLSQHMAFSAFDFSVSGVSPEIVGHVLRQWEGRDYFPLPSVFDARYPLQRVRYKHVPQEPLVLRNNGTGGWDFLFKGGVGIYSRWVHVDTRGITNAWND